MSWRGATPAGNAVYGELKHELFFVEFRRLLGLSVDLGEPAPLLGIEGDIVTVVILILQKVPVVRC